ncbi:hypothetical protein PoB_001522800 [Plakobranchus ocellatus]|uniref:Uncharacterized protein n=1 Tax=Plakobranchus ocellatus TaxID=259542 RepID=A0AAV3Z295_9GAST|nr:hypothetical protein PoB_001522800 [Plakobranchus ocellatus]
MFRTLLSPNIRLTMHVITVLLVIVVFLTSSCLAKASHCTCAEPYFPETGNDFEGSRTGDGADDGGLVVYLAALLPNTSSHPFSMTRARPAVDVAVLKLHHRGIFKRDTIKVM